MRSRNTFGWLVRKDFRELFTSRSSWLLLTGMGLLTGHSFITAVDTYAEMSGAGGGPAALRQGLSPLEGVVVPVLSSLFLAATLLLPFVVIRVIAHERENGAWKLLLQGPAKRGALMSSKLLVLLLGWLIAWIPAVIALGMWRLAGNHLSAHEVLSVAGGHLLFAWMTIGVASAAAALSAGEASAAIATLGFTIGTWALDFMGAARGGILARLAMYTPTSALRGFERGLIRLDAVVTMVVIGAAGMCLAAIWMDLGAGRRSKLQRTAVMLVVACMMFVGVSRVRGAWDVSEDRRNSFSAADEHALRQITDPLVVDVNLAEEDPRLADLRTNVLSKLERALPKLEVHYVGGTGTGMFAKPGEGYGETWYTLRGKREVTHSTAEPIVLGVLYQLAGIDAPVASDADAYPGYPLVSRPSHAGAVFFVLWPLAVVLLFFGMRRPASEFFVKPRQQDNP